MQRRTFLFATVAAAAPLFPSAPALAQAQAPAAAPPAAPVAVVQLTLTSPAFADGADIPVRFSQAAPGAAPGEGTSPALVWANPPAGTVSYVLHMHDMEVARNRTTEDQLHWLVWNIPGTATGLPEGVARGARLPDGSQQISATGPVYRGPGAPAAGPKHHYVFELIALDGMINVPGTDDAFATRAKVIEAMQGHVLGKAILFGVFRRPA